MAAGIHENEDETNVLVFDFGGVTLDISILNQSDGVILDVATTGDMNLGGRDLDEIIVNYCIEEFKNSHGVDLSNDK